MIKKLARFNIYLALAATVLLSQGCSSSKSKKEKVATRLALFMEVRKDTSARNQTVAVYRAEPIYVNVDTLPFLDEGDIDEAAVTDDFGGFSIRIKFNWRGTQMLDSMTSSNPGKRVVVACHFDKEIRWLGAPIVRKRISDGNFSFTPDATHEEADRIVLGLNNVANKLKKETF